jgi:biotin carboxyl carrier protein
MENSIHAGRDGKVAAINVNAGDSVLEGTTLITLE